MTRALSAAFRAQLLALADRHRLTHQEALEAGLSFAVNHAALSGLSRDDLRDYLDAAILKGRPMAGAEAAVAGAARVAADEEGED